MHTCDIPEIKQLSVPEKILLVEDLWDSIAAEASAVPVPPSHLAEIERRLNRQATQPGGLLTLEELQSRIETRK